MCPSGKETKNGGGFLCESKLILRFCKSLIFKYSHGDTRIEVKNRVLFCEKMVSIYHKILSGTRERVIHIEIQCKSNLNMYVIRIYIAGSNLLQASLLICSDFFFKSEMVSCRRIRSISCIEH